MMGMQSCEKLYNQKFYSWAEVGGDNTEVAIVVSEDMSLI